VFPAPAAELLKLKTLRRLLFVLGREIIAILALSALKYDFIAHKFVFLKSRNVLQMVI
jgi:hypothetical protein